MVRNGNKVVFDSEDYGGSYILHKKTGGKMKLREHEGVFVLDCLVAPAREAAKIIEDSGKDFARQVTGS